MRIAYGVHGYGRGHAARAEALLPELQRRHELLVLAGDEAYHLLRRDWAVLRIPTLRYHHGGTGRRSAVLTIGRNIPAVLDLLLGGPVTRMVRDVLREFRPQVVISDSEAWTHRAARALGIPRMSFDHFGVMAYCRLPLCPGDRIACRLESMFYRFLVARPSRSVAAAFFRAEPRRGGVTVVGPILRAEVRRTPPSEGDHLLVYFSNAAVHFTPAIEAALRELDCPVKVYGAPRGPAPGNIEFHPVANLPFLRDLAACRAVFSTAGNQLISEALHFGKPMLLMPEESLEQRLNAQIVQDWRAGMRVRPREVTPGLLRAFLARRDEYAANVRRHRRDGLPEAIEALHRAIQELAGGAPAAGAAGRP